MQVTKGTWRMREQCVPGSVSSSPAQEPGNKATTTDTPSLHCHICLQCVPSTNALTGQRTQLVNQHPAFTQNNPVPNRYAIVTHAS